MVAAWATAWRPRCLWLDRRRWRYDAVMKSTTITLPDDVALVLEREAQRRGESVSDVARRALQAYFGLGHPQPRPIPFAAVGRSGYSDISERLEELLTDEWGGAGSR